MLCSYHFKYFMVKPLEKGMVEPELSSRLRVIVFLNCSVWKSLAVSWLTFSFALHSNVHVRHAKFTLKVRATSEKIILLQIYS